MPLPEEVLKTLSDDVRNDPSIADVNDVPTLVKRFIDTKKFVGASIRPPGPDATPEAKKEFVEKMLKHDPDLVHFGDEAAIYKRLGRPEKPEDYEVPAEAKEAGLSEADIRALAHAAGLTKTQAKNLATIMAQGTAAQKKAGAEELAALKTEWGAAYEEKLLSARAQAMKAGLTEQEAAALGPKQLRAFANVAKAMGTTGNEFRRQDGGGGESKLTPSEAKLQLAEIRANPAYWDRSKNPMLHESLKEKVLKLTAMAFPE